VVSFQGRSSDLTQSTDAWTRKQYEKEAEDLIRSLELDGYRLVGSRLLAPESDVLDIQETAGVLDSLYRELGLAKREVALHCLKLSEEHWFGEKWDDCIGNARRFLECVLQEVAAAQCMHKTAVLLPSQT